MAIQPETPEEKAWLDELLAEIHAPDPEAEARAKCRMEEARWAGAQAKVALRCSVGWRYLKPGDREESLQRVYDNAVSAVRREHIATDIAAQDKRRAEYLAEQRRKDAAAYSSST